MPRLLLFTLTLVMTCAALADQAKSLRYHEQLRQRPIEGTMFDRFCDAWLEDGTMESLHDFLTKRCTAKSAKAPDHRLLALLHVRLGQDLLALESLRKAAALDTKNADIALEIARSQQRILMFDEALKTCAAWPKHGELGKVRMRCLLRLERRDEAVNAAQDLLTANADDHELADDVTELLVEEGAFDAAAANARQLIARTTDAYTRSIRQLRLGDILSRSQHKDEAIATFEEVLRATGQDSWLEDDVLAHLEAVYRREDDMSGLIAKLETLAQAQPHRARLALLLAQSQVNQGEKDKACALFRDLIARNPQRTDLREAFLDQLTRMARFTDAIEQAQALRAATSDYSTGVWH